MKRLAKNVARNSADGSASEFIAVAENGLNRGIAVLLCEAIKGPLRRRDHWTDDRNHYDAIVAYWNKVLSADGFDRISDPAFAEGFIEGALEVWSALEDSL